MPVRKKTMKTERWKEISLRYRNIHERAAINQLLCKSFKSNYELRTTQFNDDLFKMLLR